jgi:hypothetical protein
MPAFIVFKQNDDRSWTQVTDHYGRSAEDKATTPEATEAANADAAIEAVRTTAGTFVAVLVRGFRPRTHFAPPREAKQKGADF